VVLKNGLDDFDLYASVIMHGYITETNHSLQIAVKLFVNHPILQEQIKSLPTALRDSPFIFRDQMHGQIDTSFTGAL